MKPVQIGLLVIAGAIGGALVMKLMQRAPAPLPKPVAVAQVQTPAPAQTPAAPAPVEAAPVPVETAKPSPVEPPKAVARHREVSHDKTVSKPAPVPVVEAKNEPPAPVPAQAPAPVPAEPAPSVATPARPEPEPPGPAPAPPPPPNQVTLNAGMSIPVRLVDGLSSERNVPGDIFTGTLDKELVVDGFVIAERGARVEGRVVASDRGGKVKGVAALAVELTRLHTSDGQTVAVQTDSFERHADASHQEDAMKVGAGAAVGAIIGAIAGGGKGAAIGAGVGGGAGAGDVLLTRGKPVTLPSETRINFRLRNPVTLTERRG